MEEENISTVQAEEIQTESTEPEATEEPEASEETEDISREELAEAEAGERRAAAIRTVLGGVCGFVASTLLLMAIGMVFQTVPVVLFTGVAPLVWLFVRWFRGRTDTTLRWVTGVCCVLMWYMGSAVSAAAMYCSGGNIPYLMLPYVSFLSLAPNYLIPTLNSSVIYHLLFSLLGWFVVWEFTGHPFRRRSGVVNTEAEAAPEEPENAEPREEALAEADETDRD